MKTAVGGDRLGSGNKMDVSFKNYERSTHDLSYLWRSSMASGTLVPFMNQLALPGDNWRIELNTEVMTLPTIGPLFGSYKVQLDVFEVPMRLYNAKLHMNKLGIGMDMANMFLPQITLLANNHASYKKTFDDNEQINPSSLMKYLGISGIGNISGATNPCPRDFNAVPVLAYWDIYKNYYSNKQEANGYFIHSDPSFLSAQTTPISAILRSGGGVTQNVLAPAAAGTATPGDILEVTYPANCPDLLLPGNLQISWNGANVAFSTVAGNIQWNSIHKKITGMITGGPQPLQVRNVQHTWYNSLITAFGLQSFPLTNIDDMRDLILRYASAGAFKITSGSALPYSAPMKTATGANETLKYAVQFSQNALGIKTYQSDLHNNWVNTAWITGAGSISALTAINTGAGSFTIDALNLAEKVYNMLNRIAISGGTYDDWLDAVYTHERVKGVESPVYHGSLIKELAFQEVISNAASGDDPLGTLAGRGRLTDKHKGGLINIRVNEPSIIMGIVSITPRIEYSQGNDWTMNLKTFNDFHKPALDAIGFQDLVTDQLLWKDTVVASGTGAPTYASLGKQPAWINYMSNVNKVYGAFADKDDSMFMVLNRRYSNNLTTGRLSDGTTYIDPTKFNQIFAQTSLDSQNFWVQISCDITARRKMSAKVIPNL